MSKGLEALENIKSLFVGSPIDMSQQFDIIETALKDYEKLKAQDKFVDEVWKSADLPNYSKEAREKNKKLKALEIIKKHILNRDMDTSGIYLEFHIGYYEPYYTIEIREGTKQIVPLEEYDILKEVLLWD